MAQITELAAEDMDDAALKKRSERYKFFQHVGIGLGGATIFGLV